MKNSIQFRVGLALLLLCITMNGAFAQGAIGNYTTQTSFSGAGVWNDLSQSGSASYIYGQINYYDYTNTQLPFDFPYDNATESAGTTLELGPGWLSFGSTPDEDANEYAGIGNSNYPGVMSFWGGFYMFAGSGENNGYGVDASAYYGIYTETDGTAPNRVFTVQFTGVHSGFGTGYVQQGNPSTEYICSMQVKLYESSGLIQFLYQNHDQFLGVDAQYGAQYYASGIGLNGLGSPSFTSLTYGSDLAYTPSSDLQFSPPAPPVELSLEPKSLNFGTTSSQNPITMCVTASSVGGPGTILHITGATITGSSAFSIVSGPPVGSPIPQGNSMQYCIQFLPLGGGVFAGAFKLTTDGIDSGTQSVTLTGIGAVPDVSYGASNMFQGINIPLRDTSGVQYLKISSTGQTALTINSIYFYGLNGNDYFVSHMPNNPMPAGTTDSIGVRFAPDLEGRPDAHMVINTTAANNPSDTVQMEGDGTLPRLVINNAYSNTVNVSFDSVRVGVDTCMEVTLVNPGSDTLAITNNFFESADYDFTLTPLTGKDTLILPGGGSQQIQVCFMPLKPGTRLASLRITTNIQKTFNTPPRDTSGFTVNFTGIGVPFGHLAITGHAISDTTPVGVQLCMIDTLWNTGSADISVTQAAITGADSAEFAYSGLSFPLTLAANTHQTFSVCATPIMVGNRLALLSATGVVGEDQVSAFLPLDVFGTNVCDTLAFVTNFPPNSCYGSVDTATITVMNCGNISTPYQASIVGTNAAQFAVVSQNPSSNEASGSTATFMVTYTPDTTIPTSAATFNITGGIGGSLDLKAALGSSIIAGTGTAPLTAVNAAPVSFSVPVNNTGTCDWNPGTPVVIAPFAFVSGPAVIPAGSTGTLTFTFAPTSQGTFTQTVGFPASVGFSSPAPNVTISGTTSSESVPMLSAQNGFSIDQSYPNPSTGTSYVEITLPDAGLVHLAILDITGKVVENVLDEQFDAGTYSVKIIANDLASGTYFYSMTSGGVTLTRLMTILK